jgi:predicted Fe-Mo cluster-binding NifX family protein
MSTEQNEQRKTDFPKVSNPALRALAAAGYTHLEQLTEVSAAELLRLHGMGPKGIRILRAALVERGLSFAGEKRKL